MSRSKSRSIERQQQHLMTHLDHDDEYEDLKEMIKNSNYREVFISPMIRKKNALHNNNLNIAKRPPVVPKNNNICSNNKQGEKKCSLQMQKVSFILSAVQYNVILCTGYIVQNFVLVHESEADYTSREFSLSYLLYVCKKIEDTFLCISGDYLQVENVKCCKKASLTF